MNPPTDINAWLESLGLGELAPYFEAQQVTPEVLRFITDEYLYKIGITSPDHRHIILSALAPSGAHDDPPAPKVAQRKTVLLRPAEVAAPANHLQTDQAAAGPVVQPFDAPHSRKSFSGRFMLVSLCVHLFLALGAGYWVVQKIEGKRKLQFANGPPTASPSKRALEHKVTLQKKINAGGSPAQARRIAVSGLASQITLPDMPSVPTTSTQFVAGRITGMGGAGFGTGLGFGNGSGMGVGGSGGGTGKLFAMIPQVMGKRCSKADRLQRLKENGGTPECEEAVVKGLRWLKKNQNPDGSWGQEHQIAMTGLAMMALFGHCETPVSPEFGETCVKGITYLVDAGMRNGGRLGANPSSQPFCYEHAIGTYALAEATTFCKEIKYKIPNLAEVTQKAGQFIIDNQNGNGGWAYQYAKSGGHTDVSVVGWQIQALKACSHTGLEFNGMGDCIDKGLEYLATCQNEKGAFGYTGPPPKKSEAHHPLTGVGMLCYQMWGRGKGSNVRNAADHILKTSTFDFKKNANLYAHYYESQAMLQRSSSEWKRYNEMFRDQLLQNQQSDGSWGVPPGNPHVKDTLFSTCLCTLMLEVYYRFLSTGGAGGRNRFGY
jgi:hypothetical protein